ncbi:MAG: multidrug transporter AcrB, partial [Acidobacteria bacterium]
AKIIFAQEGALAIKDNWRQQVKTLLPTINEAAARRVGLSSGDIARALQEHFSGSLIGVLREGDELRKIIFRAAKPYRLSPNALKTVMVYSPALKQSIPITQVVDRFEVVFEDYKVRRYNRSLALTAQADPADGVNADALFARIKPKVEEHIDLPAGYGLEWRGQAGNSADAKGGLMSTLPLGYGAMILVVLFLFPFVRQTLVIWMAVPLSLIGVVFGLVNMHSPMDFMGLLGLLSLTGMMVKNAIVLVDETNAQINSGKARMDAVIDSAVSRVRPVVLGMLTTVLGVAPLVVDPFFKSLAVVIMFGLSFATLLTLIFIPVLYTIFFGVKNNEVG